ncbi:MAG: HTTM domain-containing protein [Gemmatimonadales bacterium]|nr:HTTM domain-containing protein [Gemmatimonadales bacterium]MDZ4390258.1 HTTM domain-containing protein [Gemmatimonadales bacterium]
MKGGIAGAWHRFWYERATSADNLGLVRITLGIGLIPLHISNFISLLSIDPAGRSYHYLEQIWYYRLLGMDQVNPHLTMFGLGLLMVATVAIILGYRTRTAIAVTILCIFYLKGVRDSAAGDVHHRYLMWVHALALLMVSRAGEVLSLDRRRLNRIGRMRPIEGWETSWPIRAIQSYIVIFYCGAGIAKLRVSGWDWLMDGTALQKFLFIKSARWGFETLTIGYDLAQFPTVAWGLVVFTIVAELSFPVLLFVGAVPRALFLLVMAGFHIANGVLLGVNFYFTPILYVVFFDLSKIRDRLSRAPGIGASRSG